nr:ribonuclease H-like domain-containing protein [Tanacetum cinerariifolium]
MTSITSLCEMACTFVQKKLEEKQLEEERAAKAQNWKLPVCYDDDDDEERSDSLDENIISRLLLFSAITPDEPVLSTNVENLIPILSESEGILDHMCDVPSIDNSPPLDVSKDQIEDFSESNEEFSSTDDDSFSFDNIDYVEASPPDSELVSSEVMEIVILKVGGIEASNDNPIPFYDPIISGTPPKLTPGSDFFLEVDAFLAVEDEFTSSQFPKLYLDPDDDHSFDFKTKSASTSLNSLLEETNNFNNSLPEFTTSSNVLCDAEYESDSSDDQSCSNEDVLETIVSKPLSEEEIILMKLWKNLFLQKDSDSLMEEIDLFCTPDYPMPPGIEDKDYDYERDILIPKDLPSNNSLSFTEKESFHFDIPLFSRPPAKPPDEIMPLCSRAHEKVVKSNHVKLVGDLCPVTKPSTSPTSFLSTSSYTWNQHLSHPGDEVLRSLVSRHFISSNKAKSTHICHACQLGKHVKPPFHSSDLIVEQRFDIIHSDLWTSSIVSSSASSPDLLHQIIASLDNKFDMIDLEALNYLLGISVDRTSTSLFLSQKKYALQLLECAHMVNFNHSRTPVDTEFKLGPEGTVNFGLQLYVLATTSLVGYTNADWTVWLRILLRELHSPLSTAILVCCDNVSAVYMSGNPVQHQRTKYIEIDIHFVCDMVTTGHVRVLHVPSCYQYANIFIKGLPSALFKDFRSSLSVRLPFAQTARTY